MILKLILIYLLAFIIIGTISLTLFVFMFKDWKYRLRWELDGYYIIPLSITVFISILISIYLIVTV